ncbi:FAD-dependent monooxygenase [Dactylosporangium sp. NBC_01737]|uniref:FAD-dependent oxidoreductase n=1 Tax=Dactylosporangium sp. NBC_01737 TaxID=2975959 RepID=UPI002E0EC2DD|nr:FAD-dependent monooxygenase [Dactylosporangium sp. NBC_01737]
MGTVTSAIVIGGGIAGPVAALALQKAGIDAAVYEAHDGFADGVGGALSIAPNGRTALAAVDADHVVERVGTPMSGMVMQSGTGKRLAEFGSFDDLPPMQLVWRHELYRALYDEAVARGVRITHGKRLVSLTGGTATFADGTTASADVIIGADGIRSTVRRLIDPAAPSPRYVGLLGFGARCPGTGVTPTGDKMHLVFGRRAFFGYQVTDGGDGGWFVNLPSKDPSYGAAFTPSEWLPILADAFTGDRIPAVDLIRRTAPADLVVTGGLEDIPSVPVWHRDRAVLIGDAAHPTSPSSGQGASLAAESAVQLARCLRDLPLPQAFTAYESLRRARVERVIAAAARTNSDKAAGPVARVLRDALMPVAMRLLANPEKWRWQFDHPIDWSATVTAATPARV